MVIKLVIISTSAGMIILLFYHLDVNESGVDFTVHANKSIRFGLAGIKSAGEGAVKEIIAAREADGPFISLSDFCNRVNMRVVNKRVMENLIKCGAMDSFGAKRSQLLAIMDQAPIWVRQRCKKTVLVVKSACLGRKKR